MKLLLKRILLIIILLLVCEFYIFCKDNNRIDDRYYNMQVEQLIKHADNFFSNNVQDSALIYYTLIYNRNIDKHDLSSLYVMCDALNGAGKIYYRLNDYKSALDVWLKMLSISENIGYDENIRAAYNNIAGIHFIFGELNVAKRYYKMAYQQNGDNKFNFIIINNLGAIANQENKLDSAMYYFREALKFCNYSNRYNTLNNVGEIYKKMNEPDSALLYYRAAINNAKSLNLVDVEAKIMSNIGKFYFDNDNMDSSQYYILNSNNIAEMKNILDIISENYLYLSKIADKKGNKSLALELYKKYSVINDSVFNALKYSDINKLQFLYDMNKVDGKIQKLNTEQLINRRTIQFQQIVQIIILSAFLLAIIVLIYIYIQKKRLDKSYDLLVKKNTKIIEQEKDTLKLKEDYTSLRTQFDELCFKSGENCNVGIEKNRKYNIDIDRYNEIKAKILDIMDHDSIIYSSEFSLSKLSELVESNQTYVSQIINESFGKNFKSFVNEYRVKEALKFLHDPQFKKYTIESISIRVGFESRSSFNIVFKEITGVTPSFYSRSLNKKDKN